MLSCLDVININVGFVHANLCECFSGSDVTRANCTKTECTQATYSLAEEFGPVQLPAGTITAAYAHQVLSLIFLFSGGQAFAYSYSGSVPYQTYSYLANESYALADRGLPNDLDAASINSDNDIYYFKGDQMYDHNGNASTIITPCNDPSASFLFVN